MPSDFLQKIRQTRPEWQGSSDAEMYQSARQRLLQANGDITPEEEAELQKTAGVTRGSFGSGVARGFVSGVNPLPEAVTRALLPQWGGIEDYVATAGEARPGEEGGHMLGNLAGFAAGTFVPLGIAGQAAKVLKGVNAAGEFTRGAKLAMLGLNAGIGAGQGYRAAEDRGRLYNQGAGVPATALAVATGAGMNLMPGLSGIGKVLGVNAGIGATQAMTENAMQYHNGLAQDLDVPALLRGAAGGAVMGGAMHGAIHGAPRGARWGARKLGIGTASTAAATHAATAAAAAGPAAPAVLVLDPAVEALLARVTGGARPPLNPEVPLSEAEHFGRVKPLYEKYDQLTRLKDAEDARLFNQTNRVMAIRDGDSTGYRVGSTAGTGKTWRTTLDPEDGGASLVVDANDVLENMTKLVALGDRDVVIPKGFQPTHRQNPEFVQIDGQRRAVTIVGKKPIAKDKARQQRFLVVAKDVEGHYNHPLEVGATDLEGLNKSFTETQGPVTEESTADFLNRRGPRPYPAGVTQDQEYRGLLAELAALGYIPEPTATPAHAAAPAPPPPAANPAPAKRGHMPVRNAPWWMPETNPLPSAWR